MRNRKIDKLDIALAVALIGAIAYKVFRIHILPEGYHADEMGSAYDAWCLLHYGVDRWLIRWPVYFLNFGSGQNALYTYMLVPLFAVFGVSKTVIRMPALFGSFLLLFCGIGVIRLTWPRGAEKTSVKRKTAVLLFTLLYGISPYTQLSARLGLESLLMLGFSTLALYLLILASEKRSTLLWLLDGFCWGLTLYTYAISYIAVPLFLLFSLAWLVPTGKIRLRQILAFAIPLVVLAFPLVLEQYVNLFGKEALSLGPFTVTKLRTYRSGELTLSNIPGNLLLTLKSALFYDWLDYNTIRRYWTFFPVSVPFFVIGLVRHIRLSVKRDNKEQDPSVLILLWFLSMLCTCCLLGTRGNLNVNPNTNKINGIFFPVMFYIVSGISFAFREWRSIRWKRHAAVAVVLAYTGYGASFAHYYLTDFHPNQYWGYLFPNTVQLIESHEELAAKPVFSQARGVAYLLSSFHSPYEKNSGICANWHHNVWTDLEKTVKKYETGASYLLAEYPYELYLYFEENGFKTFEEGNLTLFYHVSERSAD